MLLLRVRRPFLHASIVSFIMLYFTCHRHAHLIHLNYLIIVQDGDAFPASKVGEILRSGNINRNRGFHTLYIFFHISFPIDFSKVIFCGCSVSYSH